MLRVYANCESAYHIKTWTWLQDCSWKLLYGSSSKNDWIFSFIVVYIICLHVLVTCRSSAKVHICPSNWIVLISRLTHLSHSLYFSILYWWLSVVNFTTGRNIVNSIAVGVWRCELSQDFTGKHWFVCYLHSSLFFLLFFPVFTYLTNDATPCMAGYVRVMLFYCFFVGCYCAVSASIEHLLWL